MTGALDPANFIAFKLIEKVPLTHNSYRYRFELPEGKKAGLTVASCLLTKTHFEGEPGPVIRPYTPASSPDAVGYLDLVIKVYPTGKMSSHINSLAIGDTLELKGPLPKLPYKANMVKKIGMIAGGTGITPMLQVIDAVCSNAEDTTEVTLVYANNSELDIILKPELDALVAAHPKLKVHYMISALKDPEATVTGSYGLGHITREVLDQFLPSPSEDCKVLVCGPPGLMGLISGDKVSPMDQGPLVGLLADMGFESSQVFKF